MKEDARTKNTIKLSVTPYSDGLKELEDKCSELSQKLNEVFSLVHEIEEKREITIDALIGKVENQE